jgi:hypothetical protein
MYGLVAEGEPFQVFARREGGGSEHLVLKFECKEGMGVLGIRKVGRTDPAPSVMYEEADIESGSLRAGRFVHVLGSGQRQSYALSRISPELAARLPSDKWTELRPHTEYGFRYLVLPEEAVEPAKPAAVVVAAPAPPPASGPSPAAPAPPAVGSAAPAPVVARPPTPAPPAAAPLPPPQTPVSPALAATAFASLTREGALEHLRGEMAKVAALQARVAELEDLLGRSKAREKDLLDLLSRWQA